MIKLGTKSLKLKKEMSEEWQEIIELAVNLTPPEHDWSIVEAHRTVEKQQEYFKQGKSQIDGINRKGSHNYSPSLGVDIYPYQKGFGALIPNLMCYRKLLKFNNLEVSERNVQRAEKYVISKMSVVAGIFLSCAQLLQKEILWGTDWDRDGNMLDHNFQDYPHFQSVIKG